MLMGVQPEHESEMNAVLRGFLSLVREGPTFIEKYQSAVASLDKEYEKKSARLKTLDAELSQEIGKANAELERHRNDRLTALDTELSAHAESTQKQKDVLTSEIDALAQKRTAHQQAVNEHQTMLTTIQAEAARQQQERERVLNTLNNQISTARQEYQNLQNEMAALVNKYSVKR
jgi:chromosome segregation ATPase